MNDTELDLVELGSLKSATKAGGLSGVTDDLNPIARTIGASG